jgi:hypothetical protein
LEIVFVKTCMQGSSRGRIGDQNGERVNSARKAGLASAPRAIGCVSAATARGGVVVGERRACGLVWRNGVDEEPVGLAALQRQTSAVANSSSGSMYVPPERRT